ncbi:molybdopterin binding domain protein [Anaeramoeba ignava]|uniref:Molybdopterin binding domain protein n=1 Tax=Anaeramoeba ignava TaxID=1746090 RepID=A0A9Q0LJL1_ANAIG|nr:molybdopterin binding domain protein [Anaeramoeba ignava]
MFPGFQISQKISTRNFRELLQIEKKLIETIIKPKEEQRITNITKRTIQKKLEITPRIQTAGGIIIGDEILSGKIKEKNLLTLSKRLSSYDVKLKRVEIVGDCQEEIISTTRRLSQECDYVFASGGIGCTHDDITYQAIASAFNRKLVTDKDLVNEMKKFYSSVYAKKQNAVQKMATIPENSEIIKTPGLWSPLVYVENVFILPGVPELFELMLNSAFSRIVKGPRITLQMIYSDYPKEEIKEFLDDLQSQFSSVIIGCYPQADCKKAGCKSAITIEGLNEKEVIYIAQLIKDKIKGSFFKPDTKHY